MSASDNQPRKPTTRTRACPICAKPSSERYDPFCSKRCADVDLHRWLKGRYVIPGAEPGASRSEDDD